MHAKKHNFLRTTSKILQSFFEQSRIHSFEVHLGNPAVKSERNRSIHFRPHPAYKVPVPYVSFFIPTHPEGKCDSSKNYGGKTELQIKERKREKEKKQKRALLPIQKIWVGPTPHKEETRLACEMLLQEKGYKNVQINVSEIPYRGF